MEMWWYYEQQVLQMPCHKDLRVEKNDVIHPKYLGFYESIGEHPCIAHWRKRLPDNKGLHIREFADHYLLHWDWIDPSSNWIGHLILDAPHIAIPIGKLIWDWLTE